MCSYQPLIYPNNSVRHVCTCHNWTLSWFTIYTYKGKVIHIMIMVIIYSCYWLWCVFHCFTGNLKMLMRPCIWFKCYRFTQGLKLLGTFKATKRFPKQFHSVFVHNEQMLCAKDLRDLFKVTYSETGSNRLRKEEQVYSWFNDTLLDVQGKHLECFDYHGGWMLRYGVGWL